MLREVAERKHVLLGLEHELISLEEALSKGAGQVIPALHQPSGVLLDEHRAQSSGDHALVGFWDPLQQVSGEMKPEALPATALKHLHMALIRPTWASLTTSLTPVRPGSLREPMKVFQKPSLSLSPTCRPSSSRRPSALTPMAITAALEQTCRPRPSRPWR